MGRPKKKPEDKLTIPKGSRQGKPLSPLEKEELFQTYAIVQNKSEVARRMGIAPQTVGRILEELQADPDKEVRENRANITARMVGRIQNKASEVLDSITPEDLKSGRIEIHDKNGKIIGYKQYGPRLTEKAIAFGIITDKIGVTSGYERALKADYLSGALMMPNDVLGLENAIKAKLKSLKFMTIDFDNDHKELSDKAQEILIENEISREDVQEVEVLSIDEFDNPS